MQHSLLEEGLPAEGEIPGLPPNVSVIPTTEPDILLIEYGGRHWYWSISKEQWMWSVTHPLNSYPKGIGLTIWQIQQGSYENAQQALHDAAERGTAVHSGIADLLRGKTLTRREFTEEAWSYLPPFVNWYEDHKPEVFASEATVYDYRRRLAGTLDIGCTINGKPTVVDAKTSKNIYPTHQIQVNEYATMWNAMGLEPKIEQAAVLRLKSRHRRGYEFKIEDLSERRHKIFTCLHWIAHDADPSMEPTFTDPPPDELSLDLSVGSSSQCGVQ